MTRILMPLLRGLKYGTRKFLVISLERRIGLCYDWRAFLGVCHSEQILS